MAVKLAALWKKGRALVPGPDCGADDASR